MATALIGIGSNLGDSRDNIRRAVAALAAHGEIDVVMSSRLHRTRPVGGPSGQHDFFNAAAFVRTSLTPSALLQACQQIEVDLGRQPGERWAPRTMDLDLLLFDEDVIADARLVVPHPRMSFRRFVLEPAAEIAGDLYHPLCRLRLSELVEHLDTSANYVAITGAPASGKSTLAEWSRDALGCVCLRDRQMKVSPSRVTGRNLISEIELIEYRARLLDPRHWSEDEQLRSRLGTKGPLDDTRATDEPPAVSDFWFEQSRVVACLDRRDQVPTADHGESVGRLLELLNDRTRRIVRPKLLVWLDPSPGSRVFSKADLDDHHELFSAVVQTSACGPWLRLASADFEVVKTEFAAAIEAMQPLRGEVS